MRKMVLLLSVVVITAATSPAVGPQAGDIWRVGLAAVKITPEKPVPMAGYASRTEPFQAIDSDLYAKAIMIEDGDKNRALLITADLLGFPSPLSESICDKITAATGLHRRSILLNGSHTHSGPIVFLHPDNATPHDDQIREYVRTLETKVVRIARDAVAGLSPARLSWGSGVARFVMNRREFTDRGVILGTNPRGPTDRTVPVLRVDSPEGKLRAVVFGAACHCTCLTGKNMKLSGDYAGYAQQALERSHPGVQAMFMTGCGGDANPYPRGTLDTAKENGKSLGLEVARVLATKLKPVRGPVRTELRRVDLPLQKFSKEQLEQLGKGAPSYHRFFVDLALLRLNRGDSLAEHYNAPFALWQFGGDLTLVGFSGETLVDYVSMTERALGPLNLWVAGYCNDLYGYLPPDRVLEEGGYETRGLYTDAGLFALSTQKVVMAAVIEMARAAGRPQPSRPAQ